MDKNTLRIMTSSNNEHWNTPNTILAPIKNRLGPIALDPCSNAGSIVSAKTAWYGPGLNSPDGLVHDGLLESWQAGGIVYVNPPYGRKITPWVKKCAAEGALAKELRQGTEIILLGPSRTDVKWFQRFVLPTADSVILWEGRLKFEGAKAPAVFPSFIAYWGHRPIDFKIAFVGKGWAVT